jgi:hypothetical protein
MSAAYYFAKGNQVLIKHMRRLAVHGSGNNTSTGGHNHPDQLIFSWQNESDTIRPTISYPKLIPPITNASVIGLLSLCGPVVMRAQCKT